MRLGLGAGLGLVTRSRSGTVLASVFDGGTISAYTGADEDDAGDLLGVGNLPSKAFGNPDADAIRAKRGTWSIVATLNGTIRGVLLQSADETEKKWLPVTKAGGGGLLIISDDDIEIGDIISADTLVWAGIAGAGPNEPFGFTPLVSNPFDTVPTHAADAYGTHEFFGSDYLSILNDGTAPASPPNFMRHVFPGPQGGADIIGVGGNGSFTRTAGVWVVNAEIGKRYFLGGAGLASFDFGSGVPFKVVTVTANTATVLSFVGDATGATISQGWCGGAGYVNSYAVDFPGVTGKKKLYLRIRVRVSAGWTDNGNAGTKFFFFATSNPGPGGGASVNHYVGLTDGATDGGAFRPGVGVQGAFAELSPRPYVQISGVLAKDAWHDIEILLIANTPGLYNGVAKIWVGNVLRLIEVELGYCAADNTQELGIIAVATPGIYFQMTYGGGNNPVPADQYMDVDHLYASWSD